MAEEVLRYLRIDEGDALPELTGFGPFRAVVVLAAEYSQSWQNAVSEWLVANGCLYMMAWGPRCTTWDDSVDWAALVRFPDGEIPQESFVMTTWHDHQPLDEVFWYAKHVANNEAVALRGTIIIHVSLESAEEEMLARFHAAQRPG